MYRLFLSILCALILCPVAGHASAVQLPRSGETADYSPADDGADRTGKVWPSPRFSGNGDDTVTDNLTGLIWSRNANLMQGRDPGYDAEGKNGEGAITWQYALDYVKMLNAENYLGHNDWRLPNINELTSLVNQMEAHICDWLNGQDFVGAEPLFYWSSSTNVLKPTSAWVVNMDSGAVNYLGKSGLGNIWPVRSGQTGATVSAGIDLPKTGQFACFDTNGATISCAGTGQDGELQTGVAWPQPRFSDKGDQTVTDRLTGLIWIRDANLMITRDQTFAVNGPNNDGDVPWQHALDYVKKLNQEAYQGFSDWRLPNRNELASLVNYMETNPIAWLNWQGFYSVQGKYWSSGTVASATGNAWNVYTTGVILGENKSADAGGSFVWPVRGGSAANNTPIQAATAAAPPLSISTSALSNGYVGTCYSQPLAASGGKAPYTWSRTSGTLPAGLTLSSDGTIIGTPTTAATGKSITFQVKDANNKTASKSLSLTVNAAPLSISTSTLADGYLGVTYSQTMAATGGKTPYSWSVTGGALPAGLTLKASSGVISGKPTAYGSSTFTVQVKDANNKTANKSLSITVAPPLNVTTTTLPIGSIGSVYSQTLTAIGGKVPYTWSITGGSLPAGLILDAATGTINGTPTVAGTNSITVQVKDANNTTSMLDLDVTVNLPIAINTSALHDSFVGIAYSHLLAATNGVPPYSWTITGGSLPAGLSLEASTGIISGTPSTVGSSSFTVQVKDAGNAAVSNRFTIAITSFGSISGAVTDATTGAPLPGVTATLKLDFSSKNSNDNVYSCNDAALGAPDYVTVAENDKNKYSCYYSQVNTMKFNVRNPFGTDPFTIQWNGISGYIGVEYLAQGFKPSRSGTLTKASFNFPQGRDYTTARLALQLKTELGGDRGTQLAQSGQVLTYNTVPIGTPTWVDFTFDAPVSVNAGQTYYLEIQGESWYPCDSGTCIGTINWGKAVSYIDGAMSSRSGGIWYQHSDSLAFQTYLDNQLDVNVLPSTDGATISMSGGESQKMTMSLYNRSTGSWKSGGVAENLLPYLGGFEYNGDDLTIDWTIYGGLESYYDQNGWLMAKVDNYQDRWNNPPFTNLLTDQFSLTFNRILTAVTDINGTYSFPNLPDGNYTLIIYKTNYADKTTSGHLSPGQDISIASNIANYSNTAISTSSLPDGYIGYYYDETLKATGNKASCSWSINSGGLPEGFGLSASDGRISGSPTVPGSSKFTVQVKDAAGITITKALSITIYGNARNIRESTLPDAHLGVPYNQSLTVIDGTNAPLTWSIASGSLPAGLTLNSSTGAITGTPTTPYVRSYFFVMVKDSNNTTSISQFSLYVSSPPSVQIDTSILSDAVIGTAYNQSLTVSGGVAPFIWSIYSGSLPAGLTLNSSTGTITGTPTATGSSSFVVRVNDSYSSATKTLTINVTPPPFMVRNLGDTGNVTIMECTGNYDAKNPDGSINDKPRQAIATEYFKTHGDLDFLVMLSTFDFALPEAGAQGFYLEVKNDIQGIGKTLFDNSTLFGSTGMLQGTIDLGNATGLAANPYGTKLDDTVTTLNHELMHRFGAYVRFKNPDGTLNTGMLGKDSAHWSYLLDTQGSLMYGNGWKDNGNGTFTSTAKQSVYSPLDLYLMGMTAKEQVPPMLLINNPAVDPTQLPHLGDTISGTAKTVTIDDIIAAEGTRVPDAASSQKKFNVGFVLLTRPGDNATAAVQAVETVRTTFAGRFAELTRGIGGVNGVAHTLNVVIDSPADGATITGPDVTVSGAVINSTGVETGVTVNGMPATVSGSRFIVNHVPLQNGDNYLTVTATDVNGLTATGTHTVTATNGNYLRIVPNQESGTAPLDISIRLDSSFIITSPTITTSGPVPLTLTQSTSPTEYSGTISFEGIYTVTASVNGSDGKTYSDTITITVTSKSQLETLLKSKWEGIKSKISANDVEGAVAYFISPLQQDFREAFTEAENSLSLLSNYINPIELVYESDNLAKCRMMRNEEVSGQIQLVEYVVYYIKENGIWKLRDF